MRGSAGGFDQPRGRAAKPLIGANGGRQNIGANPHDEYAQTFCALGFSLAKTLSLEHTRNANRVLFAEMPEGVFMTPRKDDFVSKSLQIPKIHPTRSC